MNLNFKNFNLKSLLLENLSTKQMIAKNTFWLAVAEGVSQTFKFILIIYVARILGATEYGKLTFASAFVSLFVILSDFGLSLITTRELSQEKKKEEEFSSIFTLKILLSIGTLILMLIGSFWVTSDSIIRSIIWILAVYILANNFLEIVYAFLRARQQMQYEAWAKILQAIATTVAGLIVIFNFPSIQNLSYGYLFASLAVSIFILTFFHLKVYHFRFNWNTSVWQRFLAMSWPLGFVAIFAAVYNRIDSVMMGYWGQIIETGWYNAAYRIVDAILIPAGLISRSFYPVLSIAFKESEERLQKVWNYRMGIIILMAVPLTTGGIILAPKIIIFFYSSSFSPSILAFRVLIIMAGIMFLIGPLIQVLIVSNQQRKNFWIAFGGAIINIILNLILIPKYALYGASIATLIAMFLMFILYFVSTVKFTSVKPLNPKIYYYFFSAILANIPMYFVISYPSIYNLNVLLSVLIGVAIYLIFLFIINRMVVRYM